MVLSSTQHFTLGEAGFVAIRVGLPDCLGAHHAKNTHTEENNYSKELILTSLVTLSVQVSHHMVILPRLVVMKIML